MSRRAWQFLSKQTAISRTLEASHGKYKIHLCNRQEDISWSGFYEMAAGQSVTGLPSRDGLADPFEKASFADYRDIESRSAAELVGGTAII
jgi:hypothetical protein